jgi:hypothetical protein
MLLRCGGSRYTITQVMLYHFGYIISLDMMMIMKMKMNLIVIELLQQTVLQQNLFPAEVIAIARPAERRGGRNPRPARA